MAPPTLDQAQSVIRTHLSGHTESIVTCITPLKNSGYSYTRSIQTYVFDLATAGSTCCCFLTIASSDPTTNTLPTIHNLFTLLHDASSSLPVPVLDTTLTLLPSPFILTPPIPGRTYTSANITTLAHARRTTLRANSRADVLLDLQIGALLGRAHAGVQNDFFGPVSRVPVTPPEPTEPAQTYSWQETFTALLEAQLSAFESASFDIPYTQIRTHLSRAIGSFLFDDADTPSLVWFTGFEEDVYVLIDADAVSIAAVLPSLLTHALWADPLLESFFLPSSSTNTRTRPSEALTQAYLSSGGKPLLLFPRQRTKRIWYSLFLAFVVLREQWGDGAGAEGEDEEIKRWALNLILESTKALESAPCY